MWRRVRRARVAFDVASKRRDRVAILRRREPHSSDSGVIRTNAGARESRVFGAPIVDAPRLLDGDRSLVRDCDEPHIRTRAKMRSSVSPSPSYSNPQQMLPFSPPRMRTTYRSSSTIGLRRSPPARSTTFDRSVWRSRTCSCSPPFGDASVGLGPGVVRGAPGPGTPNDRSRCSSPWPSVQPSLRRPLLRSRSRSSTARCRFRRGTRTSAYSIPRTPP